MIPLLEQRGGSDLLGVARICSGWSCVALARMQEKTLPAKKSVGLNQP